MKVFMIYIYTHTVYIYFPKFKQLFYCKQLFFLIHGNYKDIPFICTCTVLSSMFAVFLGCTDTLHSVAGIIWRNISKLECLLCNK